MRSAGIRAAAPRAWPFVAAALLGGWLLAVTPEAHASSSSKLSLPSGPASIEGLGGSFTPSLASGTASYRVEIAVPPAAGGFAPALALEYDSGGGVSEVGLGWRLGGVPSIRRRTTEGLPTFTEADAFEAVGLGLPCDLVPVEGGFFRPEHEAGSFVRVQRSDDGSLWEARTKGGVTFRFGGDGFTEHEELNDATGDATGDATSRVVTYLLREQLDRHGRRVAYEWDTEEGHALLTSVTWNDFSADVRQRIQLVYEERPDAHELYGSGIRKVLSRRLARVDVTLGGQLVRRYELSYTDAPLPQLEAVTMLGTDGATALPTLRFEYTEPNFSAETSLVTMTTPPGRSPADPGVELADLDGDGLPDLLVTEAGSYRSSLNHDGVSWRSARDWPAAESPSVSLADEGTQLADLDGDGALDLVIKSGTDAFRYLPGGIERFDAAVPLATVPSFHFEDPELRLVDLDGDRRMDVLLTSPAGLVVSYNRGGHDWSTPETLGVLDERHELRFSDGKTQLCDVNGDRVSDLCHLRSGALTYWLGRGRGAFEPARPAQGVPSFPDNQAWRLVDLNGDGWVDLVHVGVTRVFYALAEGAGRFGEVREITDVPERGPGVHVELVDMNASGTVDILWVDVEGAPEGAWRYLELFPDGRRGLLRRIDNGLGQVTEIAYEPAALSAARSRDEGAPWTTRMNVALPVVRAVEIDGSLGDPRLTTHYHYLDGTWDPVERTFAGFGGGVQRELGDATTPTLITETRFDVGLEHPPLRGAPRWSEQRDETGHVFLRTTHEYEVMDLPVTYAYESARRTEYLEGQSTGRVTLQEWAQDEHGNVIEERHWGEVAGSNRRLGDDEALVRRTFASDTSDWLLGFVATEELLDGEGRRVAMKRNYYDGEAFEGLSLGRVTRGDLTRQEEWVGPDEDAFELVTATRYDDHGLPVETTDGIGGGRLFTWDAQDHTTLLSEEVKHDGAARLIERAETDRRFGNLLTATGYNGEVMRYEYDPLGRLTAVFKPGDPPDQPSTRYRYEHGSGISRVTTEVRLWPGREVFERSVSVVDGLGRTRATLTQEGERWLLAGVSHLDRRGQPSRVLRPRFLRTDVLDDTTLAAQLHADGAGTSLWRDALGREIATRSELGIETATQYHPLQIHRWDGGQLDPAAGYEGTPTVEHLDGLGRVVAVERVNEGMTLAARFTFDAAGNLVGRTDPEGHEARYGYDGRGRRILVDDPDLGRRELVYDATGNLLERRHPDGNVIRYAFDRAGRSVSEDWDGDGVPEVVHHWDRMPGGAPEPLLVGKLAHTTEPSGSTSYEYDARGRITWTHLTIGGPASSSAGGASSPSASRRYSTGSLYDNLDREYLHIYPDGSSLRIHRNARGQLAGYGDAVRFHFGEDGVERERHFDTGVVQKLDYDADLRMTSLRAQSASGATIEHLRWDFDAAGNVTMLRDLRKDVAPADDRTEAYTYDNLYRLRSAEGAWGKTTWEYSPSGNLLARESSVASQDVRAIAFGDGAGPHAMTRLDDRALRYDALGRMLHDGDRKYTWNGADQLVRVTTQDGATVESTFDAEGRRRIRRSTSPGGKASTTHFLSPWAEVKDGKLVRYIVHADRRIARLHDKTGRPAGAPTTLGGDIAPTVDAPLSSSDIVATRDWDVMGLLGWLAALGGALFGARRRQRALAWAAALGPRFANALGALLLAASFASLTSCSGTPTSDAPPPIEEGTIRGLSDADTLLFHDQLGSLLTETSGTGEVKARFAAYPYGVTRHQSSTESRLYANAPRDTGVGLDHMGARFYAPDLGAWTIGDPILLNAPEAVATGEFATANPYAYANLNPIVAVDSDGNFPHVLAGAFAGAGIGFGVEVARQLITTGSVKDWGRVGAAAAGGAVAGAISCAVPGAGLATVMSVGAGSTAAAGLTERLIVSGGQDAGTLTDVAIDAGVGAVTGGLLKGGSALLKKARPTKPPTAQANQTRVLDSEEAFKAQYAQLRAARGAAHAAKFDPSRAAHIFRDAAGHVNPASAGSQARFARLFENVASNPANLRTDAVQAGIITQDAANAGVRAFTQVAKSGEQIWVTVRNGLIQNAGVNPVGALR